MKTKIFIGLTLAGVMAFTSCKKDDAEKDGMMSEVATEVENFRIGSSNYTTEIVLPLEKNGQDYYTKGIIEYKVNNQLVAKVDFASAPNEKAGLTQGSSTSEFALKKQKTGSKYKKVIVKPLVKTDGCNYIVEGIINYYDYKTGKFVAAIDYGDGACDEWAVKTFANGDDPYTFSLKEWYGKDKK